MMICVKSETVPKDNIMDTISFIGDFLKVQRRAAPPAIVTAFLCWESGNIHKLTRFLSQDFVFISVHSTTEKDVLAQYQRLQRDVYKTFILDLECQDATDILAEANKRDMLRHQHRWLLINRSFNNNKYESVPSDNHEIDLISANMEFEIENDVLYSIEFVTFFQTLNILLDSDITIAIKMTDQLFHLYEIYRRGPSEKVIINKIGHQEQTLEILMIASSLPAKRRLNLHQTTLRVGTVVTDKDTLEHLDDGVNKHIDSMSKSNYLKYKHAAMVINVNTQNVFTNTWENFVNGSWTGLSVYLERNEIDLGTSPIFLLEGRLKTLNYIHAPHGGSSFFLFRKPQLSLMRNIFILPFSSSVWLASGAILILIGVLLYGIFKWEAQNNDTTRNNKEGLDIMITGSEEQKARTASWSDIILISFGQICQQGSEMEARQPTGRIISLLLYIAVMFLYTAYSACIIMLFQSTSDSIQTLKDLYESGMELAVCDNEYNRHFFPMVNDPIRKAIYNDRIKSSENFMPLEDGIDKVKNAFFAFHASEIAFKTVSETYREEERCGLKSIPFFDFFPAYVGASKESPFKEVLSFAYRRMQETGFQIRIYTQFYTKKPKCDGSSSIYVSVGITDCLAVILVLVYGIPCAIVVLLLEIIVHKILKKRGMPQMDMDLNNHKSTAIRKF
ncbi:Ionotropic receptor 75o [Blattella germanica]|nr:Ionotropic receptor 75o [Blattella germanica]